MSPASACTREPRWSFTRLWGCRRAVYLAPEVLGVKPGRGACEAGDSGAAVGEPLHRHRFPDALCTAFPGTSLYICHRMRRHHTFDCLCSRRHFLASEIWRFCEAMRPRHVRLTREFHAIATRLHDLPVGRAPSATIAIAPTRMGRRFAAFRCARGAKFPGEAESRHHSVRTTAISQVIFRCRCAPRAAARVGAQRPEAEICG